MTSNDIVIAINGQNFRVEGNVLKPVSNNFQQEVLRRLDSIESEQKKIRSEIKTMHDDQLILQTRVDMLIYGGGIAFTILCAVIAWTSLFAPRFWEHSKKETSSLQPIVITVPASAYNPQPEQKTA